jgi:hypothetical protein
MSKLQKQNRGLAFVDPQEKRIYCAGCGTWMRYEGCDIAQMDTGEWVGEFYIDEEPFAFFYWEIDDSLIAKFCGDNNLPLIRDTVILCKDSAACFGKFEEHEPEYAMFLSAIEDNLIKFYNQKKGGKHGK